MVPYRKVQKPAPGQKPYAPLRLSEGRALWRDSTALMASVDDSAYRRPRTLNWLQRLSGEGPGVPNPVPIDVFGLSADKSKPLFWRHERLSIPRAYLDNDRLVEALRQALNNAETAGRLLGWRLLDVQLSGKPKPVPFSSPLMLLATELAADKDGQKNIATHISPDRGFWRGVGPAVHAFRLRYPGGAIRSDVQSAPRSRRRSAASNPPARHSGLWRLPISGSASSCGIYCQRSDKQNHSSRPRQ